MQATIGKVPIRLREVVYTLSPFEQTVMNGNFKDVTENLHRKFAEVRLLVYKRVCLLPVTQVWLLQNWVDVGFFCIAPIAGTFWYVAQ